MAKESLDYAIVDVDLDSWLHRTHTNRKYPWERLEVGKAFEVSAEQVAAENVKFASLRAQAFAMSARHKRKFKCRRLPDGGIQVARVE